MVTLDDAKPVFSWSMAEELAATHLRTLGFTDARRTAAGRDGGVDAVGTDVVAQVKYHAQPVGAPDVQRLRGAAHGIGNVVFYSSSGYTTAARAFAEQGDIALFVYDESNRVVPVTTAAQRLSGRATLEPSGPLRTLVEKLIAARDTLLAIQRSGTQAQAFWETLRRSDWSSDQLQRGLAAAEELERFAATVARLDSRFAQQSDIVFEAINDLVANEVADASNERAVETVAKAVTEICGSVRQARAEQVALLRMLAITFGTDPQEFAIGAGETGLLSSARRP